MDFIAGIVAVECLKEALGSYSLCAAALRIGACTGTAKLRGDAEALGCAAMPPAITSLT